MKCFTQQERCLNASIRFESYFTINVFISLLVIEILKLPWLSFDPVIYYLFIQIRVKYTKWASTMYERYMSNLPYKREKRNYIRSMK